VSTHQKRFALKITKTVNTSWHLPAWYAYFPGSDAGQVRMGAALD